MPAGSEDREHGHFPPRSRLASKHAVKFTLIFLKWRPELHVKFVVKFAVKFVVKFWSTDFPEKSGSGLKPPFCKGNQVFLHAVEDPEFWGVFDTTKTSHKLHSKLHSTLHAQLHKEFVC